MNGQKFRENVSQDLDDLLYNYFDKAWPPGTSQLHAQLVDWAVRRFCPVCERGDEECPEHGEAPYPRRHFRFAR